MKKKRKNIKTVRRMFLFGISSFIIIIVTTFTIGKYWITIYGKYKESDNLDKKLVQLVEEEDKLRMDAKRLQDPDYIARYAREKYLYSKDGEFIIKIPEE